MKKLMAVCAAALCLVGCSSTPAETKKTVCTMDQDGISVETTFEHDGTKISKQINTNKVAVEALGGTEEEVEELVKQIGDIYNGIDGMTYTYEIKDGTVTETTEIDFSVVDFAKLAELGLLNSADVDYVGIEETVSALEGSANCVEQ